MNGGTHPRTDLGAYVLGGLDPAERHAVDRHLATCATCREELAALSALPPLLNRLSPAEATTDLDEVDADLSAVLDRSVGEERRRLGRAVVRWRAIAAAAVAAAVLVGAVAWQPWQEPPDRLRVEVVPVAADAGALDGTVAAYAWEWGTTVEIRVRDLPPRATYVVLAVGDDGRRERAGTWGPTSDHAALVRGASAIQRDDLARVEVTGPDGGQVFAASFDG
jgi:anti-sigma factor RsiW